MSGLLFLGNQFQAFDDNGDPLAGGIVEFYSYGTLTAKAVYNDRNLTSSAGSTITLDANGRKTIFLSSDADYRAIIKTSALVTIKDQDGGFVDVSTSVIGASGLVDNFSFEGAVSPPAIPDLWDILTPYAGGTVSVDTTKSAGGANSLKFVSLGLGAGSATSKNFISVSTIFKYLIFFSIESSVVDVRNIVNVRWYDKNKIFISSTIAYDNATTNPLAFSIRYSTVTPVANAKFAKIELIGCDASDITVGNTWFDDVMFSSFPSIFADNNFSGNNNFSGSNGHTGVEEFTGINVIRAIDTTAGVNAGPIVTLKRNKVNVANDTIGQLQLSGFNSVSVEKIFVSISARVLDGTSTSEDALIAFNTMVAGTDANRLLIAKGVYTPTAVGGDLGIDIINAKSVHANGDMLIPGSNWVDYAASRSYATTYQNTTGRPIFVSVVGHAGASYNMQGYCSVNTPPTDRTIAAHRGDSGSIHQFTVFMIVPVNWYYRVDASAGTETFWQETT